MEHAKGQILSIIYSEEQIIDFQKFIDNSDCTHVGIDRTFKLGCFYVTSFVYKSHRVVRKDTLDHPTILISSCHQISLCTKHMKENVNDYLRNKIGVKTVERLKVMDAIFGEEGILNAE